MSQNKNLYSHDHAYKSYKSMTFKQTIIENKYQEFYHSRNKYQILVYIILKLLQIISLYFLQECYLFDSKTQNCNNKPLIIMSLALILLFLIIWVYLKKRIHPFLMQFFISLSSYSIYIGYLEYLNNVQFLIIFLCLDQYVTSTFTLFNWKYYFIIVLTHSFLLYFYLIFDDYAMKTEIKENLYLFCSILLLSLIFFAVNEINLRRNWIILNSFKKSENLMLSLIENISFPLIISDASLNVVFANNFGLSLLNTERNEKFTLNVFFNDFLNSDEVQSLYSMIDNALQEKKIINKKFLGKAQNKKNLSTNTSIDFLNITICQVKYHIIFHCFIIYFIKFRFISITENVYFFALSSRKTTINK